LLGTQQVEVTMPSENLILVMGRSGVGKSYFIDKLPPKKVVNGMINLTYIVIEAYLVLLT
jgi:putative ribosome biogenesis GTPase RsgA